MTQTLLDPPPPARATAPEPVPAPVRRRPRDPRWLLPAGIAISALLHILAFTLFHFSVPSYRNAIAAVRAERASAPTPGMHALNVLPTTEAAPEPQVERPEPSETAPPVVAPVQTGPPAITIAPPVGVTRDNRSLGERTRPRADDPRLWTFTQPVLPEPDEFDIALIPLYARLNEIADSMYAAGLAAEKALDWTVTDSNGGKWGFSPGKIHLGKITLPLPFGFSAPPGRREEYQDRLRGWNDIQRQAGQAAVHDAIEDRIKAIRERNSASRDTTRRGGGGG